MQRFRFLWRTVPQRGKDQILFKLVQRSLLFLILLLLFNLLGLSTPLRSQIPMRGRAALTFVTRANQASRQHLFSPHIPPLAFPLYGGNPQLPEVALTFDDGPEPGSTPSIVATLKRFGVRATFFCVGLHAHWYPNLVRQEYMNGNLVEDHTWTHADLQRLNPADIARQLGSTARELQQITGIMPALFRPPYGSFNWPIFAQARRMALSSILWNVSVADWLAPGTDVIVARVLQATRNGSIILLHDGSPDDRLSRSQTAAALPAIITGLRQRGFRFVTIEQMIRDLGQKTPTTRARTGQGALVFITPIYIPGMLACVIRRKGLWRYIA